MNMIEEHHKRSDREIDSVKLEKYSSIQKYQWIKQYLDFPRMKWYTSNNNNKKYIPAPKLFIKDHKFLTRKEYFPTRFVIPEKLISYIRYSGLPWPKHTGYR